MTTSIFASRRTDIYNRVSGSLLVDRLLGGIPSDQKVAEGWIKKHMGADNESLVQETVAKTMVERGLEVDDAVDEVVAITKLNGFKRDELGIYIEGRQLKAALKEAANVSWPKRRWGPTNKGTRSFWAEHVFVVEDRLHLGMHEPTGVQQRFVNTWRGTGIQYEEYAENAKINFIIECDHDNEVITPEDWSEVWVRAENLGIGATRSQGFGKFVVTKWEAEGKS